ncbi:MAG: hypothetical protein OJF51_000127 [Nitrospira sp.]|jgi:hypothetical protein|nr:MAG: hypothetical protein OJF51_000127 [Nitrospira sp.]
MIGLLIAALESVRGRTKRQVEQAKADELKAELERAKGDAEQEKGEAKD